MIDRSKKSNSSLKVQFEAFERQLETAPDPQQLKALKALLERQAPWD